jgi:hypothetical protein
MKTKNIILKSLRFLAACILCVALIIGLAILLQSSHNKRQMAAATTTPLISTATNGDVVLSDEGISIPYKSVDGQVVYLQYDPHTGRICLKAESAIGTEKFLAFMKDEVVRLAATTNVIQLGGGYSFKFNGGYPTWGPYTACRGYGTFECLMFAESSTLTSNKVIVASGFEEKPAGYYPYQLASK